MAEHLYVKFRHKISGRYAKAKWSCKLLDDGYWTVDFIADYVKPNQWCADSVTEMMDKIQLEMSNWVITVKKLFPT